MGARGIRDYGGRPEIAPSPVGDIDIEPTFIEPEVVALNAEGLTNTASRPIRRNEILRSSHEFSCTGLRSTLTLREGFFSDCANPDVGLCHFLDSASEKHRHIATTLFETLVQRILQ